MIKFTEMFEHVPFVAILSLDLIGHQIHCIRKITYKWSDIQLWKRSDF